MRIAFLTSRFPYPPDRGDRNTVLNLVRTFSKRHRVTLYSLTDGSEPTGAVEKVRAHCERIDTELLPRWKSWSQAALGVFSSMPSQVHYYVCHALRARVERDVQSGAFDLVFCHTFRMAPFLPRNRDGVARVLWLGDSTGHVLGGMERFAPLWKRPGIHWERRRVERYAAATSRRFHESWALSAFDRDDLTRIGCERVVRLTHGVDERLFGVTPRPGSRPRVVFLGNMSVPHNIDAAVFSANEVWPKIRAERPDAEFWIVGASPVPAVTRLAEIPGITVTGAVPDLLEVWKEAHVLIAPLRFSTGIQNKVLEPMAAGVPVVTSTPVAQGIEAIHGEHLLVADSAETTAAATLEVLRNSAAAAVRARNAREHVRRHFSWETALARIEKVHAEVQAGRAVAVG